MEQRKLTRRQALIGLGSLVLGLSGTKTLAQDNSQDYGGVKNGVLKSPERYSFYLHTDYQDSNTNGVAELSEFTGKSRRAFFDNEQVYFRADLFNMKGKKISLGLYNPKGKLIHFANQTADNTSWIEISKGKDYLTEKYGEGRYQTVLYIDKKPYESIGFEVKKSQKQQPQRQLTPTQQNQINKFHQTISQRSRAMNQGNRNMRGDPIGFKLSNQQILNLNRDFSEKNILRHLRK